MEGSLIGYLGPRLQRGRPAREPARRARRARRARGGGARGLVGVRDGAAGRGDSTRRTSSTRACGCAPRSGPRSCSTRAKAVERELGRQPGGVRHGRGRSTSTCCCSATSSSLGAPLAPAPRGHEPPLRARAAARARSGAGAARRHPRSRPARRGARPAGAAGGRLVTPRLGGLPWRVVVRCGRVRDGNAMDDSLELAIFRGDDDPSLVAAALACRACLSGRGRVVAAGGRLRGRRSSAAASAAATCARSR